jgi:hypothetical protein
MTKSYRPKHSDEPGPHRQGVGRFFAIVAYQANIEKLRRDAAEAALMAAII